MLVVVVVVVVLIYLDFVAFLTVRGALQAVCLAHSSVSAVAVDTLPLAR